MPDKGRSTEVTLSEVNAAKFAVCKICRLGICSHEERVWLSDPIGLSHKECARRLVVYQLRSEENDIREVISIRDALKVAEADETIWKISFNSKVGERIRLVRDRDSWKLELLEVT